MKLIFDVETNGLYHIKSILSFSGLLLDDNDNIIEVIDRYYFRDKGEKIDLEAIKINGLTKEKIKEKRKNVDYPKHFREDNYINELFDKVDTLIAHNINFDLSFIKMRYEHNYINTKNKELFCTMEETQYLYDAPYEVYGEPKYPKLKESVDHFNINTDEIRNRTKSNYHDSLFDVYCTYEIYKCLMKK